MSEMDEFTYRCFACELIREGQIWLELSPVVSASGQTLCHRFYYFYSFKQFHPYFIAMSCLLIGSKIEEELRPVSRLIRVFHQMYQQRIGEPITELSDTDPIFIRWRSLLLETEKLVLSVFGYHLYGITDHPHRYILFFIKKLECDESVAQRAWNILNDSLQLPLCVQFTANTIACAALYLAAMTLGISLPQRVAWWELFDASLDDIQVITHTMIALYKRQRIDWLPDVETPAVGSISSVSTLENSSLLSPTVEIQSLLHPVPRSFPPMEVERKSEMPREDARDRLNNRVSDHLSDRSHSRDRAQHSSRHSHHSPHRSHHSHHSRHDRSRSHSHRHHHS
ncbi:hypothetical protein WA588_003320 [Blastocystis sp. NMH]